MINRNKTNEAADFASKVLSYTHDVFYLDIVHELYILVLLYIVYIS